MARPYYPTYNYYGNYPQPAFFHPWQQPPPYQVMSWQEQGQYTAAYPPGHNINGNPRLGLRSRLSQWTRHHNNQNGYTDDEDDSDEEEDDRDEEEEEEDHHHNNNYGNDEDGDEDEEEEEEEVELGMRRLSMGKSNSDDEDDDDDDIASSVFGPRAKVVVIKDMHLHMKDNQIENFTWNKKIKEKYRY